MFLGIYPKAVVAFQFAISIGFMPTFHGLRFVGLVVEALGYEGNTMFRNQFLDKNHAAMPARPHIITQVDFREIDVKGNFHSFDACIDKVECNKAQVGMTFVKIQFDALREEWFELFGRNAVGEVDQIVPFGGKEDLHGSKVS